MKRMPPRPARPDRRATAGARRGLAAVVAAAAAIGMGTAAASYAPAAQESPIDSGRSWTPSSVASIHPGILTSTRGAGDCTANFVYSDAADNLYLGQAAHCASTGAADELDGCTATSLPLGTEVRLGNSGVSGRLAYSSWLSMQEAGEADQDACRYNDFALIRIPAAARWMVNPSLPVFGGPNGINTVGVGVGEPVRTYGNSPIRQGLEALSPKQGAIVGGAGNGWSHTVYTFTPGIPGDSGSPYLDEHGAALGVLSSLSLAPQPLSNQITDLAHALSYARAGGGIAGLRLVVGDEPFLGGGIPA
jgi:hypothetical protein